MFIHRRGKLLVGLNQRLHRIVVWARVFGDHVCLDTPACTLAPICKFAEQFVGEDLGWGRRLHDLGEETRRGACLFDAGGELMGWGKGARVVVARKVVLAVGVEGRGVYYSWSCRAL